jgi:hypothetical protein
MQNRDGEIPSINQYEFELIKIISNLSQSQNMKRIKKKWVYKSIQVNQQIHWIFRQRCTDLELQMRMLWIMAIFHMKMIKHKLLLISSLYCIVILFIDSLNNRRMANNQIECHHNILQPKREWESLTRNTTPVHTGSPTATNFGAK